MDWLKELLVLYCLMEERGGAVLLWSLCLLLSVRDRCPHVGHPVLGEGLLLGKGASFKGSHSEEVDAALLEEITKGVT